MCESYQYDELTVENCATLNYLYNNILRHGLEVIPNVFNYLEGPESPLWKMQNHYIWKQSKVVFSNDFFWHEDTKRLYALVFFTPESVGAKEAVHGGAIGSVYSTLSEVVRLVYAGEQNHSEIYIALQYKSLTPINQLMLYCGTVDEAQSSDAVITVASSLFQLNASGLPTGMEFNTCVNKFSTVSSPFSTGDRVKQPFFEALRSRPGCSYRELVGLLGIRDNYSLRRDNVRTWPQPHLPLQDLEVFRDILFQGMDRRLFTHYDEHFLPPLLTADGRRPFDGYLNKKFAFERYYSKEYKQTVGLVYFSKETVNRPDQVHSGAIFCIMDSFGGNLALGAAKNSRRVVTAYLNINFLDDLVPDKMYLVRCYEMPEKGIFPTNKIFVEGIIESIKLLPDGQYMKKIHAKMDSLFVYIATNKAPPVLKPQSSNL